jgi:hypothetical protein
MGFQNCVAQCLFTIAVQLALTQILGTLSLQNNAAKVIFFIAFGLFFGVGVLCDQLVLYRYFG